MSTTATPSGSRLERLPMVILLLEDAVQPQNPMPQTPACLDPKSYFRNPTPETLLPKL